MIRCTIHSRSKCGWLLRRRNCLCLFGLLPPNRAERLYQQLCTHWFKNNLNHDTYCYIDTNAPSNYDIEIGIVFFDFAFSSDTGYYAYFDSALGKGLTGILWEEIDKVTTQ